MPATHFQHATRSGIGFVSSNETRPRHLHPKNRSHLGFVPQNLPGRVPTTFPNPNGLDQLGSTNTEQTRVRFHAILRVYGRES